MAIVIKDGVRYRERDVDRFTLGRVKVKEPVKEVDEPEAPETSATKVDDPEVTKVREPETAKRRRAAK